MSSSFGIVFSVLLLLPLYPAWRITVNNVVDAPSRFPIRSCMAKTDPLGFRFEPAEKDALERAARADDRSVSAFGRKIIVDWLKQNGWLKPGKEKR